MALTEAQKQVLAVGLLAETDPVLVGWRNVRNDVFLYEWVNTETLTDAWHNGCAKRELFEATDVSKFDNLTAGKRDAWKLMLDNAPADMTRANMRKAVIDVWGVTDSKAVLQSCLKKATRGELYLGGTTPVTNTNTVVALKLNFQGSISIQEVSDAMNKFGG